MADENNPQFDPNNGVNPNTNPAPAPTPAPPEAAAPAETFNIDTDNSETPPAAAMPENPLESGNGQLSSISSEPEFQAPPVEPAPVEPAPMEPTPIEPAMPMTEPAPVETAPMEPATPMPAPVAPQPPMDAAEMQSEAVAEPAPVASEPVYATEMDEKPKLNIKKIAIIGGGVLAVLLVIWLIFHFFIAASPQDSDVPPAIEIDPSSLQDSNDQTVDQNSEEELVNTLDEIFSEEDSSEDVPPSIQTIETDEESSTSSGKILR